MSKVLDRQCMNSGGPRSRHSADHACHKQLDDLPESWSEPSGNLPDTAGCVGAYTAGGLKF